MSEENKYLCLTCKFEPDWSERTGSDYSRQVGRCKKSVILPKMPATFQCQIVSIIRYSDDSGIPTRCATWEKK